MQNQPHLLLSDTLSEFNEIFHGFTTRELGADYDRIASLGRILVSQIFYVTQIHSNRVAIIDENSQLSQLPECDALVTHLTDVVIGVRTADCLPILVYDEKQNVIAAIHAGYKGLAHGIIENTLQTMTRAYQSNPADLWVSLGPCISMAHYEVGEEVIDLFAQNLPKQFVFLKNQHNDKYQLGLQETAVKVLQHQGVTPSRIETTMLCTFKDDHLFESYRRNRSSGRQFNFIGMMSPRH